MQRAEGRPVSRVWRPSSAAGARIASYRHPAVHVDDDGITAAKSISWWAKSREFLADQCGSPAIEFAIIAPAFIALLIAIVQVTLLFFAQQNLESVAEDTVRKLKTGSAQQSGMTQAQFKNAVCAALPSFMKCANVMIDVRVATSFSAANTAPPTITYDASGNPNNSWQFAPGGTGDIVVVKTMYVWDVARGPLGFDLSTMSSNKRLLVATSVFKTEPYA